MKRMILLCAKWKSSRFLQLVRAISLNAWMEIPLSFMSQGDPESVPMSD